MRFIQPMKFDGNYRDASWAGYKFREVLGYTTGRHTGVDYNLGAGNADFGLPIHAISEGTVVHSARHDDIGFGNTVIIRHDLPAALQAELGTGALYSRYMHLDVRAVSVGDRLQTGQYIGTCGNSGTQLAHLHLDLWKANLGSHLSYHKDTELASYLDPFEFIETHKHEIGGEMPIADTDHEYGRWNKLFVQIRGRSGSRAEFREAAVGRTWLRAMEILSDSPEADAATAREAWARANQEAVAERDRIIAELKAVNAQLGSRPTREEYATALAKVDDLTGQLGKADAKVTETLAALEAEKLNVKEKTVLVHDETLTRDVASIRGMLINFIGYVKRKLGK